MTLGKAWGLRVVLIFFSFGISFFLSEVALRIYTGPRYYFTEPNEVYLKRLRPDQSVSFTLNKEFGTTKITINSMGFRGRQIQPKADGVYRIVTLGDSFTFGYGVNDAETWPHHLEEILNSNSPRARYEVINMGIPGFAIDQSYLLLKEHARRLGPDLIIAGAHLSQIYWISGHQWTRNDDGDAIRISIKTDFRPVDNLLLNKTPLTAVKFMRRHSYLVDAMANMAKRFAFENEPILWLYMKDSEFSPIQRAAWERQLESFILLKRYSDMIKSKFFVAIIPRHSEVSEKAWGGSMRKLVKYKEAALNEDWWQARFISHLGKNQIGYLDSLPSFRRNYSTDLYFSIDPHFTKTGNRYFAELVFEELSRGGYFLKGDR